MKEKIINLLEENQDGLTMSKMAKELGVTIYTLNKELCVLISQSKVRVIDVGASKLVMRVEGR